MAQLRGSLLEYLDLKAHKIVITSEAESEEGKAKATLLLEETLRTHWPRRGRCETDVKALRLSVLLSHEEKIYRFIQTAQHKFLLLQESIKQELENLKNFIGVFEIHIPELIGEVQDFNHTNLSTLQAIDGKCRKAVEVYQFEYEILSGKISNLLEKETEIILSNLLDYRKVHPASSGYSESELLELGNLVTTQVSDMKSVISTWKDSYTVLEAKQKASLLTVNEFNKVFESTTLATCRTHGLGAIYGGPRRKVP